MGILVKKKFGNRSCQNTNRMTLTLIFVIAHTMSTLWSNGTCHIFYKFICLSVVLRIYKSFTIVLSVISLVITPRLHRTRQLTCGAAPYQLKTSTLDMSMQLLKMLWNFCQHIINRTMEQFTFRDLWCPAAPHSV